MVFFDKQKSYNWCKSCFEKHLLCWYILLFTVYMPIVYVFQMAVRNILPRLCKPETEARYVDNIHCMLGNISSFCHLLIFFFKLNFQILFSKCYHSIKQIGSNSRPTFIWPLTWSKLFAKIISRRQVETCKEIVMFRIYWLQKSLKDHLIFVADSY